MPRRNRRRRRRSGYPLWVRYAGLCVGLAILLIIAQIALQAVRSDPRDARVFAERELRLSALRPNEKVLAEVSVWQRPAIDYFRATRGLLVLTDAPAKDTIHPIGGRVIYLGLQPRDPLGPADAPPTFDERDWVIDTLSAMTPARTFLYLARGIRIPSATGLTLGVPSGAGDDADALMKAANHKYSQLRAVGWQRREARRARERARVVMIHEGRRAWYHTVRRGEAVASVARMFNTTPELIRSLNGLPNDKIRIGQTLMVKAWTKTPVPFPAGIVPDSLPPPAPAPPVR